jgi:hypothetical protein
LYTKSFVNAFHAGAKPDNLISGFEKIGVCPFNPEIPRSSDSAVEPVDPVVFGTVNIGAEINEMD